MMEENEPSIDEAADIVDAGMMRGLRAAIPILFRSMSVSQKAELAQALSYLFDMKVYEDEAKRIAGLFAKLCDEEAKLRWEIEELKRENNQLRGEIDNLRMRASKAQSFMDNLAKRVAKAEAHMSKQPLFGKGKDNENPK